MRRPKKKTFDPLTRDCAACGALVGKGCINVGNDGSDLRIPYATRLVHAARLEQGDSP